MLESREACFEAIKNGWDFEVLINGERPVSVQWWAKSITSNGQPYPELIWEVAAETIMHHWTQEQRVQEYNKWLLQQAA